MTLKKNSSIKLYLEKYSEFYLSKYLVSKKKFEIVLQRKIKRDFFQKKLCQSDYIIANEMINLLTKKYKSMGFFDEKQMIKNRIESLVKKGSSYKKIFFKLKNDKFEEDLIFEFLNKIWNNTVCINEVLINFCKKKKIFIYDKSWDMNDNNYFKKNFAKMIREGFSSEECLNFLKNIMKN